MEPSNKISGYSFCIITNGKRIQKLAREIESIHALKMPHYEILVGGDLRNESQHVTVVSLPETARSGRLGELRNRLVERAQYDHIIVADDDMVFHDDFYRGLLAYGEDYDVLCVKLLNVDKSRYYDWATIGGSRGHVLLDYDETDSGVYVTGGLCIMKAYVADQVKWDETLGFYQQEDIDFSVRLKKAGFTIKFCRFSTVTHNDPRYKQVGNQVYGFNPLQFWLLKLICGKVFRTLTELVSKYKEWQ
jgi:GT2 family glycosyltransferase